MAVERNSGSKMDLIGLGVCVVLAGFQPNAAADRTLSSDLFAGRTKKPLFAAINIIIAFACAISVCLQAESTQWTHTF